MPGVETLLTDEGVDTSPGRLRPTDVCDGTLAAKLDIAVKYLRRVRTEAITVPGAWGKSYLDVTSPMPLIDAMLNAHFAADTRRVLVRGFRDTDSLLGEGIARAILSDGYRAIDNLDGLTAVLDGVTRAGANVEIQRVDLSERAMRVFFLAPEITALAPTLLRGYRSPFNDLGEQQPIVSAGFVASNSETGGGAFTIVPRFTFQICNNGLTMTKDAMRQVHLGGRLDEGIVRWSAETQAANVDLIARQATDAVATFLDVDYMERTLSAIEAQAGTPIDRPDEALKIVAQRLRYTEAERESLLSLFIKGGQATSGGVLNAVTALAQTVDDPDRAAEIEASALEALAVVA